MLKSTIPFGQSLEKYKHVGVADIKPEVVDAPVVDAPVEKPKRGRKVGSKSKKVSVVKFDRTPVLFNFN